MEAFDLVIVGAGKLNQALTLRTGCTYSNHAQASTA
jgi:hypothetical protein